MKYVKYLLLLIVVLGLLFFAKGLMTPSISYDTEVVVNRPVKEAWAVMSDESRLGEWINGYKSTELVSGTPNTVGAVSKIYIEDRGEEMIMEETITSLKPNDHIAMTFAADFMNMDYKMTLSEKDGKTTIKSSSTTEGNGLFAKSMISFMKSAMKEQEDINLNNLKKVIEENTKDYFPAPKIEEIEEPKAEAAEE